MAQYVSSDLTSNSSTGSGLISLLQQLPATDYSVSIYKIFLLICKCRAGSILTEEYYTFFDVQVLYELIIIMFLQWFYLKKFSPKYL